MKVITNKKITLLMALFFMSVYNHTQALKYKLSPSLISLFASPSSLTHGSLSFHPAQEHEQQGYVQAITELVNDIKVTFNDNHHASLFFAENFGLCNQEKVALLVSRLKQEKFVKWHSYLMLFLEKALMLKESGVLANSRNYLPHDIYSIEAERDLIELFFNLLTSKELGAAIKLLE